MTGTPDPLEHEDDDEIEPTDYKGEIPVDAPARQTDDQRGQEALAAIVPSTVTKEIPVETPPNAKPTAAGIGGAAATLTWTLIAALTSVGDKLGEAGLVSVTGASAIVLGGVLFYLIPAGTKSETA